MGIISTIFAKFRSTQSAPPVSGHSQSGQIVAPDPSTPSLTPSPPANPAGSIVTMAQLEAEIVKAQIVNPNATELQVSQTRVLKRTNWLKRVVVIGVIIAIPVGVVAVANLPVAFIRRSVAQTLPVLLIPSYLTIEENFKKGVTSLESARQLIDNATTALDIDRGKERLKSASEQINSIPTWFMEDWENHQRYYRWYGWYDWRFSPAGLQRARAEIGTLEARAFQETNAQELLTTAELSLTKAKQSYQLATAVGDKKAAIDSWRTALDQLNQIPSATLAGKQAQQKLAPATREFQEVVGLVAGNQKTSSHFTVAREYAKRAAEQGRNPPHRAQRWREIITFWEGAIQELQKVPDSDLEGYTQAQQAIVEYKQQLSEVRLRLDLEVQSEAALQTAQKQIIELQAQANRLDRNQLISQVEQIMLNLDRVRNGTTSYLEAQRLKLLAQDFLKQVQGGKS